MSGVNLHRSVNYGATRETIRGSRSDVRILRFRWLDMTKRDLRRIGAHPDHWYSMAWSHEIKSGKAIGREFAGNPIVLYRGTSEKVFALEDRCAHRQVPLHLGVVDDDELRCGYHGWRYNCQGACVDVPYLGRGRLPNGVKSYPVTEVDGMVFVYPGSNLKVAEQRKPTSVGSKADRRYITRRLHRDVACHYTFMHENLFDMNHQFLHRRNMGMIKATCLGRATGENWSEVSYTFSRLSGRQSVGEAAILNVFEKNDSSRRDLMTIRTDYPHQSLRFWVDDGDPVLDVWLGYTPLGRLQKSNRTFGYLSVKKPALSWILYAAWPFITLFTERIFREDKEIVEKEQSAYDAQGADGNNEVFPPLLDLRTVLANCGQPLESHQEMLRNVVTGPEKAA